MSGWIPGYYWMHFLDLFACVRTYLECKYIKMYTVFVTAGLFKWRICRLVSDSKHLTAQIDVQMWTFARRQSSINTRSAVRNLTWVWVISIRAYWAILEIFSKWNRKHMKLLPEPHLIPSSSGTFTYFTSSRNFNELVCEECNAGLPRFVNIPGCHSCKTPGGFKTVAIFAATARRCMLRLFKLFHPKLFGHGVSVGMSTAGNSHEFVHSFLAPLHVSFMRMNLEWRGSWSS